MQTQLDALYQSMAAELAVIIEDADVKGQAARAELAQVTQNARTFILSVIGVALLLMVLAGLAIGWTITQPPQKDHDDYAQSSWWRPRCRCTVHPADQRAW